PHGDVTPVLRPCEDRRAVQGIDSGREPLPPSFLKLRIGGNVRQLFPEFTWLGTRGRARRRLRSCAARSRIDGNRDVSALELKTCHVFLGPRPRVGGASRGASRGPTGGGGSLATGLR